MAFAIMRAKKLKTMANVTASLNHCYRERETMNADAGRTPDNEHRAAESTEEATTKLTAILPSKRRKDAVLAIEYVLTASPEWWAETSTSEQHQFFNLAEKWLADKYGQKNIITATIHRDETSPHLSAFVAPVTEDGRLSAKDFIGNKSKMSKDQTSFATAVQDLGLERGIEGSKATHQSIKKHYAAIQRSETERVVIRPESVEPRVLKKGIFTTTVESSAHIASRLTEAVKDGYQEVAANASVAIQDRKRLTDLTKTMENQRNELKRAHSPFQGLTKNQIRNLLEQAEALKKENEVRKSRSVSRRFRDGNEL